MKLKKIKPPSTKGGKVIQISEPVDYDSQPPIFSLERIQEGDYSFAVLDKEDKAQFAESIYKRRNVAWRQIRQIDRHGLGVEKIPKKQIKAPIPKFITADKEDFLVFRFHGMKPMVGYRINNIFYFLWFDHNFTLYDHS